VKTYKHDINKDMEMFGVNGKNDCPSLLDFRTFRELNDPDYFQKATVLNGTVTWPHEQDIFPDTLYEDSIPLNAEC